MISTLQKLIYTIGQVAAASNIVVNYVAKMVLMWIVSPSLQTQSLLLLALIIHSQPNKEPLMNKVS